MHCVGTPNFCHQSICTSYSWSCPLSCQVKTHSGLFCSSWTLWLSCPPSSSCLPSWSCPPNSVWTCRFSPSVQTLPTALLCTISLVPPFPPPSNVTSSQHRTRGVGNVTLCRENTAPENKQGMAFSQWPSLQP